jgi:hypothetical protein
MRGNLGAGAGPGNCASEKPPGGPAHINVRRNMMVVLDIIAGRDQSDQKMELIL